MQIRSFQAGDETAQVSIYNEAAGSLPKFKPATLDEVRRRCRAPEFDPSSRFFAIEEDQAVGYAAFHANGRVSYPWCRKGYEDCVRPLFETILQAARKRNLKKVFAAYRADWPAQRDFFLEHGFGQKREMMNFWLDPADMPTPAARRSFLIKPAQPQDIPAVLQLTPQAIRAKTAAELEKYLLHNALFPADAVFVARARTGSAVLAAGVLVAAPGYADVRQVDAGMPCFRLGAFGTEGMQTKRINGLFSFVAPEDSELNQVALDLLSHAAFRMQDTDVPAFAAQVPSDVPYLLRFYQHHFRRQGSFPVYERAP